MRTLVVVPTHDEAANIADLLDGLDRHVPDVDILVVDDASTDDTRAIVRARPNFGGRLRIVERDEKKGLGDAYVHAFRLALADGYDAVVEIDADLSHDPAALPMMLDLARRDIAVVIGSRYIPGGSVVGWPRRRTWLSRWGNRYAAIALGLAINDATAGYRVYRSDTLRRIDLEAVRAEGYGFQIEMTYRTAATGATIVEVPIAFTDRVRGTSKMSGRIIVEAMTLVTRWGIADRLPGR